MKENISKLFRRVIILASVLLGLMVVGAIVLSMFGYAFHSGTYIEGRNDQHLVVLNSAPTVMGGNKGKFEKLESGDRILVLHDGIAESYPAQTHVYFCLCLEEGDLSDVPEQILNELREMGWIS